MAAYILAIDQGTTSSRALLVRRDGTIAALAQEELPQHFPASGEVEQEAEDIWATVLACCRAVLKQAGAGASDIAGIGITNQRETTLVWERATGRAIHRAIVWQDRRTAHTCARLEAQGHGALVRARTGLLIDPYFSATKIAHILDAVPEARARAETGELAFGTVDSFLLFRLTGGRVHTTDATNAARTLLFDIHTGAWDDDLLAVFGVPRALLPQVRDCAADFGATDPDLFGAPIPIRGMAGDQQAAMVGQACFQPGMVKSTYGTGCFALLNTGATPVASRHRLLTTIAYQIDGRRTYALEGSIFVAGAAVQWLRDGLKIISSAAESDRLAAEADEGQDVILVPAFVGLGAPYWRPDVRGALFGLTRATGPAELARSALEAVCFQTCDLIDAMHADWPGEGGGTVLRVDGGMTRSDFTMQRLADLLGAPVDRPAETETTVLGAAYLAGLQSGFFPPPDIFAEGWRLERRFVPVMPAEARAARLAAWRAAVGCLIGRD
ncbi:glycerol kinase GlpK [Xanthobacter autotrophicus]|uniref:glycerol kinase GlpK n=1 Tax=Xanthobacter TaxID=279 RepID=UPI0024AA97BF|nr:glycerol kinase GlpK [Xanthobacter autotrophicus]MDI4665212.1 glycerol kinase GlpK [Xanthobacter autotrophicus]